MLSDGDIDYVLSELQQTTVGYINKGWKTPPAGTHWANAINRLKNPPLAVVVKGNAKVGETLVAVVTP